jgi:VanZ family protein
MAKKIIGLLLIVCWMGVMFNFSSKASNVSNGTSKTLIKLAIKVYEHITNDQLNETYWTDKLNYPVRKLAHFTEYLILGLLLYYYFKFFNFKYAYLYALLICIGFACTDEYHQLFVSGRTGQVKDIIIDSCGSIFGLVFTKVMELISDIKKNKENNIV